MSLEAWGDGGDDYNPFERASDAGWFDPEDYSKGAIDILEERERQEVKEGWTPEHDDEHVGGELAEAAACYARMSAFPGPNMGTPPDWPFEGHWFKRGPRRRDLVRAGALIAAEIDRLDRAEGAK